MRASRSPLALVERLEDQTLLEMLATLDHAENPDFMRKILTTEVLNRLNRVRRDVNESTRDASAFINHLRGSVDEAAREVHETERDVERVTARHHYASENESTEQAHRASRAIEQVRADVEASAEAWDRLRRLRAQALEQPTQDEPPHSEDVD